MLYEWSVAVDDGQVHACLDTPSTTVVSGVVRFSGWLFHTRQRVDRVVLRIGGEPVRARHGILRPDVGSHYVEAPTAAESGFELERELAPGLHEVEAEITLASGVLHRIALPRCAVRPQPLSARGARVVRAWRQRIRGAYAAALRWRREHGRWPRPAEIPALLRATIRFL